MAESEFDKSRAVTYSGIQVDLITRVALLEDGSKAQLSPRELRALSAYGKLTTKHLSDRSKELASIMNQLAEAEEYADIANPEPITSGGAREALSKLSKKLKLKTPLSLKKT